MKTRIKSVSGYGFLSFLDPFEFNIEDLEGMTLQIDGSNLDDPKADSNGAGKSSLLEAINWGLYGELCRKNRYKDEVIHKHSNKCEIKITLEWDDGSEWKITRTRIEESGAELRLQSNGEQIQKSATTQDRQEFLEKNLGMNFTSFICTTMFGREFNNFPDLPPFERSSIVTRVRGLERYTRASEIARRRGNEVGQKIHSLHTELEKAESLLEEVRTTNYRENIENFENERESSIKDLRERIIHLEAEFLCEKEGVDERLSKIVIDLEEEKSQLKKLSRSIPDMDELASDKGECFKAMMGAQTDLARWTNAVRLLQEKIESFKRLGEGECPTCLQTITGKYLKHEIDRLITEQKNADQNRVSYEETFREADRNFKASEKAYEQGKAKIEAKRVKEETCIQLEKRADDVKESAEPQLKRIQDQIKGLLLEIEKKKAEKNPFQQMEKDRVARAKTLAKETGELKRQKEDQEHILQIYLFWQDGFKKIKFMLFDQTAVELESIANNILQEYTNDLEIIFSTDRVTKAGTTKDEFHVVVVDSEGIEVSYDMYSGGEKQKIRLSIALALARLIQDQYGRGFNFMGFDEPNDGLDSVGKDANLSTFTQLSQDTGKAILVTDHDANFKDRFDRNILVVREGKCSKIRTDGKNERP
jgi:DNA repair exonuclease SbcCD ATPase subunit